MNFDVQKYRYPPPLSTALYISEAKINSHNVNDT